MHLFYRYCYNHLINCCFGASVDWSTYLKTHWIIIHIYKEMKGNHFVEPLIQSQVNSKRGRSSDLGCLLEFWTKTHTHDFKSFINLYFIIKSKHISFKSLEHAGKYLEMCFKTAFIHEVTFVLPNNRRPCIHSIVN